MTRGAVAYSAAPGKKEAMSTKTTAQTSDGLLHVYLNDHLAGATAGMELAKRMAGSAQPGSESAAVLTRVTGEIIAVRRPGKPAGRHRPAGESGRVRASRVRSGGRSGIFPNGRRSSPGPATATATRAALTSW